MHGLFQSFHPGRVGETHHLARVRGAEVDPGHCGDMGLEQEFG